MANDIARRLAIYWVLFSLLLCGGAEARLPEYEEPIRAVYLIRHGEYDQEDERDPDVGRALVGLGYAQARLIAARLVETGTVFTSIQASTMTRARQTGEVVAACFPGLELALHRDIRECTPTTRRQDIMAREDPAEVAACEANLAAAWDRIFRHAGGTDAHDIVVCHGNVIRWFVTRALEVDNEAWLGMSIANCSLTVIQVKPDGSCKLVAYADAGHIPPGMQTYPGTTVEDDHEWWNLNLPHEFAVADVTMTLRYYPDGWPGSNYTATIEGDGQANVLGVLVDTHRDPDSGRFIHHPGQGADRLPVNETTRIEASDVENLLTAFITHDFINMPDSYGEGPNLTITNGVARVGLSMIIDAPSTSVTLQTGKYSKTVTAVSRPPHRFKSLVESFKETLGGICPVEPVYTFNNGHSCPKQM